MFFLEVDTEKRVGIWSNDVPIKMKFSQLSGHSVASRFVPHTSKLIKLCE